MTRKSIQRSKKRPKKRSRKRFPKKKTKMTKTAKKAKTTKKTTKKTSKEKGIREGSFVKSELKKFKDLQTKHKIVDIPFSDTNSLGTKATLGDIHFHYQNYSNVMDYFRVIDHPNTCFFEKGKAFLNLNINNMKEGIYPLEHNIESFQKNLMKCIKSKNRFIPVVLNLITNEGNHANILLVDKEEKVVELYEPHGSRPSDSVLDGVVGAYRKKIAAAKNFWRVSLPGYKVINVVDIRKGTAFQMKYDPDNHSGFCVTWSILFVHYRILNPHVKLENLVEYISLRITTKKILQYAKYVEDNIKGKI